MTDSELSLDDIDGILASPEPQKRTSRARKVASEPRDIMTWFKLFHQSQVDCDVPNHELVSDRPRSKGMTTPIGDLNVCRLCFLEGADKT